MAFARRSNTPKIVQPGAQRSPLWWLLLPLVLVAVAWGAYEYGRAQVIFDAGEAREQISSLELQVDKLETERADLYQRLAALERSGQIDREAARTVREEIKLIQDEQLKMEEELVFLRGIVSGRSAGKGSLRIQDFKLEAQELGKGVRYSFTVSHVLEGLKQATGHIRLTVEGVQEGEAKALGLAAVTEDKTESLKMRFKYFQKVSGVLQLPEGFIANSITIDIKPDGKKLSPLTQRYKWSLGG